MVDNLLRFSGISKKKLWNMKVMLIQIVIGTLVTVTKVFVQGLEDLERKSRQKTIKTTQY